MVINEKQRDFYVNHDYIKSLIRDHKYRLAKKVCLELIEDYPGDFYLYNYLIRICLDTGLYDEAKEYFNYTKEEYIFLEKVMLALIEQDMDTIRKLYRKYFDGYYEVKLDRTLQHYFDLKIYLCSLLGERCSIKTEGDYYRSQFEKYDREKAIEHFFEVRATSLKEKGIKRDFVEGITVSDIFDEIKEIIENNLGYSYINDFKETYLIHYPGCGKDEHDKNLDYIRVVTVYGTSNIMQFNPSIPRSIYKCIEYPVLEKIKNNEKIKRLSNIEKFNLKYCNIDKNNK